MTKTVEQLEELLGKVTPEDADGDWVPDSYCDGRHSPSDRELIFIAPSLARRVIATEAQLAAMTAERDALVGAAYVAAEDAIREDEAKGDLSNGAAEWACGTIRALTPADAITTLDHIRAQAKAEGRAELLAEQKAAREYSEIWASKEPRHD